MGIDSWPKKTIRELCFKVGDGIHGTPNYIEDGDIFFINGNNLKNGQIVITENTKKVSRKELDKNFIELNEHTLLISINGTLGSMAFYHNENVMLGKSSAYLNFKTDSNRFYYYYFQLKGVQEYFYNNATGSTIKNLGLKTIQDFSVPCPEKSIQKQIAKVLSDLDAKIEVNNKINAELEGMAKLIYDYWFVQFDFPFDFSFDSAQDAAQGKPADDTSKPQDVKPYKSSGGKMVRNEQLKREIPVGWGVKTINEVITVKDGTHDSPKPSEEGFALITSKHLSSAGIDFKSAYLISKDDYDNVNKRSQVNTGDILFSMIGNIGTVYKVEEKEINFAIKNVALFKTSDNQEIKNYVYQYLRSYDMLRYMGNVIAGSIQKFIGLGSLRNIPFLYNEDVIKSFVKRTEPIFHKLEINKQENQKLSELRDWLLPMLMNGQVRVADAEQYVADNDVRMAAEKEEAYGK